MIRNLCLSKYMCALDSNVYIYVCRYRPRIPGWWFQTFFTFHLIYGIILPIDSYFSRGLKPPTRYIITFIPAPLGPSDEHYPELAEDLRAAIERECLGRQMTVLRSTGPLPGRWFVISWCFLNNGRIGVLTNKVWRYEWI